MAKAIPDGFRTLTPHLVVADAAAAIALYTRAFGAEELARHAAPDGKVMHATLRIGDSLLMLNDELPDWGVLGPAARGGTSVALHLYVEDADAAFARAQDAGLEAVMPLDDAFWGDRYGKLRDPWGHEWSIATHQRDLTSQEIEEAAAATFG